MRPTGGPDPPGNDAASPGEPTPGDALLELVSISAGYGRFRALFDVSLSVPTGAAVGVVGPNGAGKTTLARVCSGLVRPARGQVRFAGEDVTALPAHRLARRGLAHVPEGRGVFATLSVEENLALAFRQGQGRVAATRTLGQAYELFPRLGERRRQEAGTLSGGEQRLLSLARVLARPPRLVIADELTLGLDPGMVEAVHNALASLSGQGVTLMVIEQRPALASAVADRLVLMRHGRVHRTGPSSQVGGDADRLLDG
ncbi:MAG TPA: ABC transporter ATP-binding protein [Acidimicrobiales bacterium]|nr:ABC transporter ATP-binding protein [Acidimicrobiales bacterium]